MICVEGGSCERRGITETLFTSTMSSLQLSPESFMPKHEKFSLKELTPQQVFIYSRIVPSIFVVIGIICALIGARDLIYAKFSNEWPTTKGQIVDSSIEQHRKSGDNKSTTYHANILYEFTVDGITYNGTRVAYGDFGRSTSAHARSIVGRYPVKKEVQIFYRENNPKVSILEPGIQKQAWLLPAFGLSFVLMGFLIALRLPREIRKQM